MHEIAWGTWPDSDAVFLHSNCVLGIPWIPIFTFVNHNLTKESDSELELCIFAVPELTVKFTYCGNFRIYGISYVLLFTQKIFLCISRLITPINVYCVLIYIRGYTHTIVLMHTLGLVLCLPVNHCNNLMHNL